MNVDTQNDKPDDQWYYEDLTKAIRETSLSFLPALLIEVVETCRERKVFRSDVAMISIVTRVCQIEKE